MSASEWCSWVRRPTVGNVSAGSRPSWWCKTGHVTGGCQRRRKGEYGELHDHGDIFCNDCWCVQSECGVTTSGVEFAVTKGCTELKCKNNLTIL